MRVRFSTFQKLHFDTTKTPVELPGGKKLRAAGADTGPGPSLSSMQSWLTQPTELNILFGNKILQDYSWELTLQCSGLFFWDSSSSRRKMLSTKFRQDFTTWKDDKWGKEKRQPAEISGERPPSLPIQH